MYPYPILTSFNDDYIDSYFDVEYHLKEIGMESKKIIANFILRNDKIEEFIKEDKARIILHLECPITSYRTIIECPREDREVSFFINNKLMKESLELTSLIVANKEISRYENDSINKDIYGINYQVKNLEKGSLLGASITQIIELTSDKDDFERISSIINVGIYKDDYMSVDIDQDIILVKLPENLYKQYNKFSNNNFSDGKLSDIIMSATILPSLIYVLDMMGSEEHQVDSELIWFKVIRDKLLTKNIEIEDINTVYPSYILAQMILENPLERAFEHLEEKGEEINCT